MRILLVEDEAVLGKAVSVHLRKFHAVDWVQTADAATEAFFTVSYDMVLLDLNLPDGHGIDILTSLRQNAPPVSVIIITARDQIRDRIEGLNGGADDYVVKPFDLDELNARIHSVQRRSSIRPTAKVVVGDLSIEVSTRKISKSGVEVHLTAREWALLECLLQRAGAIVSKAKLEETMYEFGSDIESNTVEVYISRLRRKLGDGVIRTLRGLGYRLDV